MSDLEIRHARDDEYDIVASLTVDAFAEFAAGMSPDAWSQFAQQIANVKAHTTDGELLVAVRDGRIVGAVTLFTAWRGAQEDSYGIRGLAVPPWERGTGVGSALIGWCIERARREGRARVVVTTTPEMEDARELYARLGFVRETSLDHMPAPGVHASGYAIDLTS